MSQSLQRPLSLREENIPLNSVVIQDQVLQQQTLSLETKLKPVLEKKQEIGLPKMEQTSSGLKFLDILPPKKRSLEVNDDEAAEVICFLETDKLELNKQG